MVADPRAWYKQREFFLQWLKMDQYPDMVRDPKKYPGFSPVVATDLRTSLDMTLESVVRNERSDYRELMLTNKYYLNGRLAAMYGAEAKLTLEPRDHVQRHARALVLGHERPCGKAVDVDERDREQL